MEAALQAVVMRVAEVPEGEAWGWAGLVARWAAAGAPAACLMELGAAGQAEAALEVAAEVDALAQRAVVALEEVVTAAVAKAAVARVAEMQGKEKLEAHEVMAEVTVAHCLA